MFGIDCVEYIIIGNVICTEFVFLFLAGLTVADSANNAIQSIWAASMWQLAFRQQSFHQLSSPDLQQRNCHTLASIGFRFFSLHAAMCHVHRHSNAVLLFHFRSTKKKFTRKQCTVSKASKQKNEFKFNSTKANVPSIFTANAFDLI